MTMGVLSTYSIFSHEPVFQNSSKNVSKSDKNQSKNHSFSLEGTGRKVTNAEMGDDIFIWILFRRSNGWVVTRSMIKNKAKELTDSTTSKLVHQMGGVQVRFLKVWIQIYSQIWA